MKRFKPFKDFVTREGTRYTEVGLVEADDGEWCRYADVAHLIEEETGGECHECGGDGTDGSDDGYIPDSCPDCNGTGRQMEDDEEAMLSKDDREAIHAAEEHQERIHGDRNGTYWFRTGAEWMADRRDRQIKALQSRIDELETALIDIRDNLIVELKAENWDTGNEDWLIAKALKQEDHNG